MRLVKFIAVTGEKIAINPDFVQCLFYVTKGNSSNPELIDKEYTTITMADGSQHGVNMSLDTVMSRLDFYDIHKIKTEVKS